MNIPTKIKKMRELLGKATPGPARSTYSIEYRADNGVAFALVYLPEVDDMGSAIQCMTVNPVEDATLIAELRNEADEFLDFMDEAIVFKELALKLIKDGATIPHSQFTGFNPDDIFEHGNHCRKFYLKWCPNET